MSVIDQLEEFFKIIEIKIEHTFDFFYQLIRFLYKNEIDFQNNQVLKKHLEHF